MPMEKQNTVENQLAHTITQTEFDSDYDKTAKKLLANKQILAQIMKGCVDEYSECSVDEIAVYLQLYRILREPQRLARLAFTLMIQTDLRKFLK